MKNFIKKLNVSLLAITFSAQAFAAVGNQVGDINRALYNRETLYSAFLTVSRDLSDLQRQDALNLWVSSVNKKDPSYLKGNYLLLKDTVRNKQLLDLASHYYYVKNVDQGRKALWFYFHSLSSWFFDIAGNPLLAGSSFQSKAISMVPSSINEVNAFANCSNNVPDIRTVANKCLTQSLKNMVGVASSMVNDKNFLAAASVTSYTGSIAGNKVELFTQNPYTPEIVQYMAPMTKKVQSATNPVTNKAYSKMTVNDFKAILKTRADVDKVFSKAEGFPTNLDPASPDFHKLFAAQLANGEKNIFGQVYNTISQAKESIFIDVYFFGGSTGVFLAKKLIDMVQKNPALKVFMMTDRWNTMGYRNEMDAAFNFLRAYAENFPEDRILVMPPNITLKRTSLPSFADLLIDDSLVRGISQMAPVKDKLGVFLKGKSDHSKVIVIDGKNAQTGVAYVGSKNYTDTSGGVSYDEVAKIEGPAVAVILDSYYHDLKMAIVQEHDGAALKFAGFTPQNKAYIDSMYAKATGAAAPTDAFQIAAKLLQPIDVLNRASGGSILQSLNVPVVKKGNTTLQIGENNIYGSIRTAQTQDIHFILSAKKQIIISEQFLYDPQVVEAIKTALTKNPSLKAYILLAPLDNIYSSVKMFAHIPNITFIRDLKAFANRVYVKWNKPKAAFLGALVAANKQYGVSLSPEYHLKGLSIDGVTAENRAACGAYSNEGKVVDADGAKAASTISGVPVLVTGSANKDNMTMLGGFREFQVAIFNDKLATAKHDCLFWSRFTDADHSSEIDIKTMNLPPQLKAKGVTEETMIEIIKTLLVSAYNFKLY